MLKINFYARTYLSRIFLCCLGFCLCLVSSSANITVSTTASATTSLIQSLPITKSPTPRNLKESYEEYDGNGDRDLIFDTFKVYEDDGNIEKGIRKLDTSFENTDKLDSSEERKPRTNATESKSLKIRPPVPSSSESFLSSVAEDESIDRSDSVSTNHNDDDESIIFEDSELDNRKPNISGTLVTKLIPEILKYNGRMVMPSSEEQQQQDRSKSTEGARNRSTSVVQKLPSLRKVRQDSEAESTVLSVPYFARNVSRLEDIFDIYNPYRLLDIWEDNEELTKMTLQCRGQMEIFLAALQRGEPWAIKMWDASGHYSGGYFWGNQYWMGSRTLCRELAEEHPDLPFNVEFSIARINLTVKLHLVRKHGQSQFIGICLPYVCNKRDVHKMVEQLMIASDVEDDREAEVIKIKSHYDYYYMVHDKTFWLVIFSSALAFILLFIGTLLDLSMEKKKFCGDVCRKNYKYDNYTYAVNPPLQPYTDNVKVEVEGCITECRSASSGAVTPTSETEDSKRGLWQEILLSFSITRNLRQICDSTIGADTIPIIHGLRSISMGWVILGHTCVVAFKYSDNMDFRKVVERELLFQTINNTAFTVDTFFFISGLLVSFLYFRTMAKVNVNKITKTTGFLSHCIEFIGLLGYRFCRLTVPYIFTLGLVEISMKWFYYNSVFDPPADDHINCPNYWWRNLLYINTLFPVKDMCMLWSWYLADDTQFYILGIVLLILAVRHFRAASISVAVLLIVSWCTTGYIAYLNNHMPNIDDPLALFDKIYDKPWTRFGPYLIGMIVGWILFKTNCKISMKKPLVMFGWTLCTIAMLSLVYGLYKTQLDSVTAAAYSSLSHTAWAIGLSWIVIACTTGHGGYVNKLLSSKLLIPFSRTTYCAYLIHPIIIRWVVMRRDSPVHLAEETIAIMFLGQLVASYILAFVLSLTFEAPIVSLLKIVSPTKRNKLQ